MGDPTIPELAAWCRREADDMTDGGGVTPTRLRNLRAIAAALERAERLEAALAKVAPDPGGAPCVCTERAGDGVWLLQCDCDNTGDRVDMAFWCAAKTLHERIKAALTPPAEKEPDR